MLGPCGINCSECKFLGKECNGCRTCNGKVFWANGICPIYECVINKNNYKNCGECKNLPCQIMYDTRDPSLTVEEHTKEIEKHVINLRKMLSNK
jgi:hypothetical protein